MSKYKITLNGTPFPEFKGESKGIEGEVNCKLRVIEGELYKCKHCGCDVIMYEPRVDFDYMFKCTNKDCHYNSNPVYCGSCSEHDYFYEEKAGE